MKILHVSIIIIICFCKINLKAQINFAKAYDLLSSNEWIGCITSSDHQFIFFSGEGVCNSGDCVFIAKSNLDGDILDTLIIESSIIDLCPNNELSALGDTLFLFGHVPDQNHLKWIVILLDQNLSLIKEIIFDPFIEDSVFAENMLIHKNFLYLGGRTYNSLGGEELVFIKSDFDGNIIEQESFNEFANPNRTNILGDFVLTNDGNFLISNKYYESETGEWRVGVCKFDTNFNTLWIKNLPPRGKDDFNIMGRIASLENGDFIFTSGLYIIDSIFSKEYFWDKGEFPNVIYKFDKDGEIIWSDTLYTKILKDIWAAPFQKISKIIPASDGSVVGIGVYEHPDSEPGRWGWIFKYSSTGELIWQHYYSHSAFRGKTFLLDIIEENSGDFLCSGQAIDNSGNLTNNSYSWLFRLDSLGCFNAECSLDSLNEITTLVEAESPKLLTKNFKVYPNPTQQNIIVELQEQLKNEKWRWVIFSYNGQKIKGNNDFEYGPFEIYLPNKFQPGEYFLTLTNLKGIVLTKKLIIL